MMKKASTRGTWGVRILIKLFTLILAVLVFWLLGFFLEDIESIQGPDYLQIECTHVDQNLVEKQQSLERQIVDLKWEIATKREQQQLVGDSSQNLQCTISQLLELQRLALQKQVSLSDSQKGDLSTSLGHFLDNQKTYQTLNQRIADLTSRKLQSEEEKRQIDRRIELQGKPAREEFQRQIASHRYRLAFYQLVLLVPLLLAAGYLLLWKRSNVFFPLVFSFGLATLVRVGLVMHEYFPSEYFKYILILSLLGVVACLLIHLIKIVAHPKRDWLRRQYREAYERFLCPLCEYPIRTGPRKFLYWTRRTVHKILPQGDALGTGEPYTCPSCGTLLFEVCPSCQKVRHSLLSHCEHCGAEKQMEWEDVLGGTPCQPVRSP